MRTTKATSFQAVLVLAFFCAYAFSAFEDPVRASEDSISFLKRNPKFPIENVVTIVCAKKELNMFSFGTGVVIDADGYFVLTAAHLGLIQDEDTVIYGTNESGCVDFKPGTNFVLPDTDKIEKDPRFTTCVNRYSFKKAKLDFSFEDERYPAQSGDEEEDALKNISKLLGKWKLLFDIKSFDIKSREESSSYHYDLMLLKMKTPFSQAVKSISILPEDAEFKLTTVYDIGLQREWAFSNGSKSTDGCYFQKGGWLPRQYHKNPTPPFHRTFHVYRP